jgi:hypothetical protein
MLKRILVLGAAALVILFVGAACGSDDEGAEPTATEASVPTDEPAQRAVRTRLFEWSIDPDVASIAAGSITFQADNSGLLTHELKIVRTDFAVSELPTMDDGSVDEDADDIEVVGALLDIGDGRSDSGTFDLEAGSYVLLCNIVTETDSGAEVHYKLGMVAGFEVTR